MIGIGVDLTTQALALAVFGIYGLLSGAWLWCWVRFRSCWKCNFIIKFCFDFAICLGCGITFFVLELAIFGYAFFFYHIAVAIICGVIIYAVITKLTAYKYNEIDKKITLILTKIKASKIGKFLNK